MDISISKLHERTTSASVSPLRVATDENFRDIIGEFAVPETENTIPQAASSQNSCILL